MLQDQTLQAKIARLNDPRVTALAEETGKLIEGDPSSPLALVNLRKLNLIFAAPDPRIQNMVLPVLLPGSARAIVNQSIARLGDFIDQDQATPDQVNYVARSLLLTMRYEFLYTSAARDALLTIGPRALDILPELWRSITEEDSMCPSDSLWRVINAVDPSKRFLYPTL